MIEDIVISLEMIEIEMGDRGSKSYVFVCNSIGLTSPGRYTECMKYIS